MKGAGLFLSFVVRVLFPENCLFCGGSTGGATRRRIRTIPPGWPPASIDFICADHNLRINRFLEVPARVLCDRCWFTLVPARAELDTVSGEEMMSVAPFVTDKKLVELIRFLKFRRGRSASVPLAWWMARALVDALAGAKDLPGERLLIVPVPLHVRRKRTRGYNQSALLAARIGSILDVEVAGNCLVRRRYTKPQTSLDRQGRVRNVEGAFVAGKGPCLDGRTVVLVDDLQTTGATLRACADALRQAARVPIIVLTAGMPPDGR